MGTSCIVAHSTQSTLNESVAMVNNSLNQQWFPHIPATRQQNAMQLVKITDNSEVSPSALSMTDHKRETLRTLIVSLSTAYSVKDWLAMPYCLSNEPRISQRSMKNWLHPQGPCTSSSPFPEVAIHHTIMSHNKTTTAFTEVKVQMLCACANILRRSKFYLFMMFQSARYALDRRTSLTLF